jgi:hypothetical protein
MRFLIRLISPGVVRSRGFALFCVVYFTILAIVIALMESLTPLKSIVFVSIMSVSGIVAWLAGLSIMNEAFDESGKPRQRH